jgi:hypothetical protein
MSLKIKDTSIWIEVKNADVRIGYFTINRFWLFEETGLPKFSANVYLEYSVNSEIYFRKSVTIEWLSLEELTFSDLYMKLKQTEEFSLAVDNIPQYVTPVVTE